MRTQANLATADVQVPRGNTPADDGINRDHAAALGLPARHQKLEIRKRDL